MQQFGELSRFIELGRLRKRRRCVLLPLCAMSDLAVAVLCIVFVSWMMEHAAGRAGGQLIDVGALHRASSEAAARAAQADNTPAVGRRLCNAASDLMS